MPQTDYPIYMPTGFEGQIPNDRMVKHIRGTQDEYVNGHTAAIPYGRVVRLDATDPTKVLPLSADAQTMAGVTVFSHIYEKAADGTAGVPVERPISFLVEGEINMIAEEAVTPADTVFARFLANGSPGASDGIGRVRTDADNGGATERADAVPNAKFLTSAAAGEIVRVYVNFN